MHVSFSSLDRQFANPEPYLDDIREVVRRGDFTLGAAVTEYEERFARIHEAPHAIGVGSGTDALILPLKLLGVGPGDEVITCANTFIASVGSIVATGATPVMVDSENGYVMDITQLENAITPKTKAIVPVHYTGNIVDMPALMAIARKHGLYVVEDACQAILGTLDGAFVGSWSDAASISLHPLKNINVWGDAGVVLTHSPELNEKLRLYRNHGLENRDEAPCFGVNSRMDTVQAVVGNRLIEQVDSITERRIEVAQRFDQGLADLGECIDIPVRRPGVRHVYHLYIVRAQRRDDLMAHLHRQGIEAKVHYPIPLHLQKAAEPYGFQEGDFPVTEEHSRCAITLPGHEHLTDDEIDYTIEQVRAFYS